MIRGGVKFELKNLLYLYKMNPALNPPLFHDDIFSTMGEFEFWYWFCRQLRQGKGYQKALPVEESDKKNYVTRKFILYFCFYILHFFSWGLPVIFFISGNTEIERISFMLATIF